MVRLFSTIRTIRTDCCAIFQHRFCEKKIFLFYSALPLGAPWMALVIILLFCLTAATFVSHTVASLILMPVIATIGISLGMPEIAVMGSAFAGIEVVC